MTASLWWTLGIAVVAFAIFVWLVREGAFLRVSQYWNETFEELKKCTWPSWDELKGSTIVVIVAIALLGAFTIIVDKAVLLVILNIV